MKKIESIKKDTLWILPNSKKNQMLEELDYETTLTNVKMMSMEELLRHYYFDYTKETVFRLMNKYDIKLNIAKIYLKNMYYLNDCYYDSDKLNELTLKKRFLLDNNLLILDPFFSYYLKKHQIVVTGYSNLTKFEQKTLEEIKKITQVEVFQEEIPAKKNITVKEFTTLEEEVNFTVNEIIKLLEQKISPNRIKLAGISKEYIYQVEKIFEMYQIPIDLKEKRPLYGTKIINNFLSFLTLGVDFEKAVERVILLYGNQEGNVSLLNQLVDICNQYTWCTEDPMKIIDALIDDFKNTNQVTKKLDNAVEVVSLENLALREDDYLFILGFNHGSFPTIYKDEDFFSDIVKKELPLETTIEKNKLAKEILLNTIYSLKNVFISYKLKTPFETFYPSTLIKEEGWEVITPQEEISISYSEKYYQLELAKKLDTYLKYGTMDDKLPIYYSHYKDFPYLTYDNQFTSIAPKKLKEKINGKLLLSYSSMDQYHRCAFRYYLSQILKVQKYEPSFAQKIGSIFHEVLSVSFKNNFDFESSFSESIKSYTFTVEEEFFLERLKKELEFVINTIKKQHDLSGFTKMLFEHKVYLNVREDFPVTFMGIIDKILYKEEQNRTLFSIIDYKTGTPQTSLSTIPHGIGMQLPIYVYLSRHLKEWDNPKIVGFYLQKIIHNEFNITLNKSYEEKKEESLKLAGYTVDQEDLIEKFDPTYENSEMIQGLRKSSKGFYAYSKILNDEQIDSLCLLVETKIKEAANQILKAKFQINPKRMGLNNIGCEFCPFQDLCYKTEKDIVDVEEYNGLEFLGGDFCGVDE